jgi:hypothetical protein
MVAPEPPVVLHHGTTLSRAEQLLRTVPNPNFIDPGGNWYNRAGGFSAVVAGTPDYGLGTPEKYARAKAGNFPTEGGPVILEIEVPADIVNIVWNHPDLGYSADSGEIRFESGAGLEELQQAWPTLVKRILPL